MTDAELDAMERDARRFLSPDVPSILLAQHVKALVVELRRLRGATQPEVLPFNPPVVFMPSRSNPPGVATA